MALRPRLFLSAVLAVLLAGGILTLLPVAQSSAARAPVASQPVSIMSEIYRDKIKTNATDWPAPANRSQYLSASLADLWAKVDAKPPPNGETGAIDFDFMADTNALTLKNYIVSVERSGPPAKQSPDMASVAVRLIYKEPYAGHGKSVVTYDFVREDGAWKIDNIHTKKWSVRDMLSRWLKEP